MTHKAPDSTRHPVVVDGNMTASTTAHGWRSTWYSTRQWFGFVQAERLPQYAQLQALLRFFRGTVIARHLLLHHPHPFPHPLHLFPQHDVLHAPSAAQREAKQDGAGFSTVAST